MSDIEHKAYEFKSIYYEIGLVSTIAMAQILCQGSITMSLSTMDVILKSIGGAVRPTIKVWFMGSYALTLGTFILISGRLGDVYGLKKIFAIGWVWVCLSSLITGLSYYSKSIIFYIICRALQGIGFALLLPCGMGIVGNIYPNGFRKNLAFSVIGAAGPTGAVFGAVFSAIIAQLWWWPWCFFLITIIAAAFFLISLYLIPNNVNKISNNYRQLDLLGSSMGTIGLILLNIVLNQGPFIGWGTSYIIVLLILSVALIVGFFAYEIKFSEFPLLPKSIFNVKIGLVLICISLGWGSFGIWQYYYWVIILELRGYNPIKGSLLYVSVLIMGSAAAILVAFIINKVRPSFILLAAGIGFNVGCIMLSVMPVHESFWGISFGQLLILTWGMDLSFSAGSIILSDYLPRKHQGMAGSLISTVVNYSVSFFLSLGSNIEVETYKLNPNVLQSYHNAIYFAIGISGLAVLFSITFAIIQYRDHDASGTFDGKTLTPSPSDSSSPIK